MSTSKVKTERVFEPHFEITSEREPNKIGTLTSTDEAGSKKKVKKKIGQERDKIKESANRETEHFCSLSFSH